MQVEGAHLLLISGKRMTGEQAPLTHTQGKEKQRTGAPMEVSEIEQGTGTIGTPLSPSSSSATPHLFLDKWQHLNL